MATFLLIAGVALPSFLAGIASVLWWAVPRLENLYLFRPSREVGKTPAHAGIPFDQHFIETADGCRLSAWHLCPHDPPASVIYFHGNGGNLGSLSEILELLYTRGLEVFAVDYRGYGWSTGVPTEKGVYEDARAAVEYFRRSLQRPGPPLIYWGRSLGSSVAAHVAARLAPGGLILESPFRSKKALVKHYPQFRPFHFFSRCRLETLRYLRAHVFPVLVIHGDLDRTVPLQEAEELYSRLQGPKEFYCVKGADHISLHRLDSQAYMERILRFIASVRPPVIH